MTCVIGVRGDGWAAIAADRGLWDGNGVMALEEPKVRRVKEHLIAGAGSWAVLHGLVDVVIGGTHCVKDPFVLSHQVRQADLGDDENKAELLIAAPGGRLMVVTSDGGAGYLRGPVVGLGCCDVAVGYVLAKLEVRGDREWVKDTLYEALSVQEGNSDGCRAPYDVMTTLDE